MKNFFSEVDGVTLTFSDFKVADNGIKFIKIYFERPDDKTFFAYLESKIPGFEIVATEGMSVEEIQRWLTYAMRNSFLMWDKAHRNAGDFVAEVS